MVIFVYMLLLLLAGVVLRIHQFLGGTYNLAPAFLVEDVIGLTFLFFGMVAIWGYARNKRYFSQGLWRAYFVLVVVTMPIAPLISPKYQEVAAEHGVGAMWGAYALSTL